MSEQTVVPEAPKGTLSEVISSLLDEKEAQTGIPLFGIGLRSSISLPIMIGDKTHEVELFVQRMLPPCPSDQDYGYELNDVTVERGITLSHVTGQGDEATRIQRRGAVMDFDAFVRWGVPDESVQKKMQDKMEELDSNTWMSEDYLDAMTDRWMNRQPGHSGIGNEKVLH